MMGPLFLLLVLLVAVGGITFGQISGLKNRLAMLEREREKDRELLEAVLLEDTAKLRRLMGTRE